jgi:hypothetical protein
MTWRDKLEIGLKKDAEFREDNLPAFEVDGPVKASGPGRSPVVPEAKRLATEANQASEATRSARRKARAKRSKAR